jgi:hypothetical protein
MIHSLTNQHDVPDNALTDVARKIIWDPRVTTRRSPIKENSYRVFYNNNKDNEQQQQQR